MIRATCNYTSLAELPTGMNLKAYVESVRPLDYDFCLNRGEEYLLFGVLEQFGTIWLYVASIEDDIEIDIVPAVFFSFDEIMPPDMIVRMTKDLRLEIVPQRLAKIAHWFERYVDGDGGVVNIVESIIITNRPVMPLTV